MVMGRADEAQGEGEKKGPRPSQQARSFSLQSPLPDTRRSAGRSPPRPRRITPTGPPSQSPPAPSAAPRISVPQSGRVHLIKTTLSRTRPRTAAPASETPAPTVPATPPRPRHGRHTPRPRPLPRTGPWPILVRSSIAPHQAFAHRLPPAQARASFLLPSSDPDPSALRTLDHPHPSPQSTSPPSDQILPLRFHLIPPVIAFAFSGLAPSLPSLPASRPPFYSILSSAAHPVVASPPYPPAPVPQQLPPATPSDPAPAPSPPAADLPHLFIVIHSPSYLSSSARPAATRAMYNQGPRSQQRPCSQPDRHTPPDPIIHTYIHTYTCPIRPRLRPRRPIQGLDPFVQSNVSPPCLRTRVPAPTFCTRAQRRASPAPSHSREPLAQVRSASLQTRFPRRRSAIIIIIIIIITLLFVIIVAITIRSISVAHTLAGRDRHAPRSRTHRRPAPVYASTVASRRVAMHSTRNELEGSLPASYLRVARCRPLSISRFRIPHSTFRVPFSVSIILAARSRPVTHRTSLRSALVSLMPSAGQASPVCPSALPSAPRLLARPLVRGAASGV
ncbi:hypothetical protein HETIRDRAFT_453796 [Heterobasidion irregulare TC 32-1]|uniref:Uncharacterized protein n=1 Tax=Heterobasidion irregulare (strain TC 32-1) TaxID=747525 RepID=W4K0M1_HETIT|nr:uncharacterized protein HETIRDRAFT_453796 [Heterobasidion irregulare TC 32-1]ETW79368.1 hypothetical protein HETIRDRAFT_453796 [Heterobasidion irregulare TC 32-1]